MRLIFRNDDVMLAQERIVILLQDFLGDIAGMYRLFMFMIAFVFGSYVDFISKVMWIKKRYIFKDYRFSNPNSH